jgi:hypothetical protein
MASNYNMRGRALEIGMFKGGDRALEIGMFGMAGLWK